MGGRGGVQSVAWGKAPRTAVTSCLVQLAPLLLGMKIGQARLVGSSHQRQTVKIGQSWCVITFALNSKSKESRK